MNLTKNCAIKAIPYKVVFNRKPRFERLDVADRHFTGRILKNIFMIMIKMIS